MWNGNWVECDYGWVLDGMGMGELEWERNEMEWKWGEVE